jgi:3-oxoacyl-[acyl-carrier protein] reductase
MNLDLTGHRALVCGASGGIGLACARELAALGARVTLLARRQDALATAVATLPPVPGGHDTLAADLTDVDATVRAVVARADTIAPPTTPSTYTILINNTGGPPPGPAIDAVASDLLACFTAQLLTAHALVRALLPGFKARAYGRVINISSTSVKQPIPNLGISNIVRPAVAAWGKCLATELGPFGVTVNNVLPGYTDTDRLRALVKGRATSQGVDESRVRSDIIAATPVGRFGTPDEIAAVVAFLASPAAAYVNGINVPVDGGRLASL